MVHERDVRETLRPKPRPPKLLTVRDLVPELEVPKLRTPEQPDMYSRRVLLEQCVCKCMLPTGGQNVSDKSAL